jgi:hypothetical protein
MNELATTKQSLFRCKINYCILFEKIGARFYCLVLNYIFKVFNLFTSISQYTLEKCDVKKYRHSLLIHFAGVPYLKE